MITEWELKRRHVKELQVFRRASIELNKLHDASDIGSEEWLAKFKMWRLICDPTVLSVMAHIEFDSSTDRFTGFDNIEAGPLAERKEG